MFLSPITCLEGLSSPFFKGWAGRGLLSPPNSTARQGRALQAVAALQRGLWRPPTQPSFLEFSSQILSPLKTCWPGRQVVLLLSEYVGIWSLWKQACPLLNSSMSSWALPPPAYKPVPRGKKKSRHNREPLTILTLTITAAHTKNSMPSAPSHNFLVHFNISKADAWFPIGSLHWIGSASFSRDAWTNSGPYHQCGLRLDLDTAQSCSHCAEEETEVQRSAQGHRSEVKMSPVLSILPSNQAYWCAVHVIIFSKSLPALFINNQRA